MFHLELAWGTRAESYSTLVAIAASPVVFGRVRQISHVVSIPDGVFPLELVLKNPRECKNRLLRLADSLGVTRAARETMTSVYENLG